MNKIAVIDYGMGNLRSVEKAIEHVSGRSEVIVTCDPGVVRGADRVVFPGQGAMPDCIRELEARGLHAAVLEMQMPNLERRLRGQAVATRAVHDAVGGVAVASAAR